MTVRVSKPAFNIREALNSLRRKIGIKGGELMAAETVDDVYKVVGSNRNILINGDFRVSQRGDFTTASSSSTGAYYVDRWFCDHSGWTANKQVISADVPGMPRASKAFQLTATQDFTGYLGFRQKVEYSDQLIGRTLTYSGYVKSNSSNARLTVYIAGSAQVFYSTTHSGSGGWERLTVTFTVGAGATMIYTDVFFASSSIGNVTVKNGDYFAATGLQLETGSVATPFEFRPYGTELALCQRYFWKPGGGFFGSYNTTTKVIVNYKFPVSMRATPTMGSTGALLTYNVPYVLGGATATYDSVENASVDGCNFNYVSTSASYAVGTPISVSIPAILFSSEL